MNKSMKITFGITTFNRLEYLKKMKASLEASVDVTKLNIRIYDDQSSEYDLDHLKSLFPYAVDVIRRNKKMYADKNTKQMYKDFLATDDDVFINADSDMVFNPGWLEFLLDNLEKTNGVLSLYNSNSHKFLDKNSPDFGYKEHLGAAGTVFSRQILEKIINRFDDSSPYSFDWKWSEYLVSELNVRLACSYESHFQHIGYRGQNNLEVLKDFDFGLNFLPKNDINTEAMMDLMYDFTSSARTNYESEIKKSIGNEEIFSYLDRVLNSGPKLIHSEIDATSTKLLISVILKRFLFRLTGIKLKIF